MATKVKTGVLGTLTELNFADNGKARFGAGNDLQIYHNGSNSYIDDVGTGALNIRSSGIYLEKFDGSEVMASFLADGAATLHHNGSAKLATTSSGIDVTGTITGDGLTIEPTTATGLIYGADGTNSYINFEANSVAASVQLYAGQSSGGYFSIGTKNNSGTLAEKMRIDGSGVVGIGTNSAAIASGSAGLVIHSTTGGTGSTGASRLRFTNTTTGQASTDGVELSLDGNTNNFYIENRESTGSTIFYQGAERMRIDSSGRVGLGSQIASNQASTYDARANDFVISGSGDTGMTIAGGGSENLRLQFTVNGDTGLNRGEINYDNNDNSLSFATAGSNRMRIDSAGDARFAANATGAALIKGVSGDQADRDNSGYPQYTFVGNEGTGMRRVSSNILAFDSSGAEAMRIDSSGRLLVGTTSSSSACSIHALAQPTVPAFFTKNTTTGAIHYASFFRNSGGTEIGFIKISNTGTTYDTGSDYRLKENAQPIQNGLERLNQLNPVKFDWKEDGTSSEGFIAHEVQEIFPDAVSGEKDAETMQGMDYGRITPLLVKAIQEQQAQIDELKAKLESK